MHTNTDHDMCMFVLTMHAMYIQKNQIVYAWICSIWAWMCSICIYQQVFAYIWVSRLLKWWEKIIYTQHMHINELHESNMPMVWLSICAFTCIYMHFTVHVSSLGNTAANTLKLYCREVRDLPQKDSRSLWCSIIVAYCSADTA